MRHENQGEKTHHDDVPCLPYISHAIHTTVAGAPEEAQRKVVPYSNAQISEEIGQLLSVHIQWNLFKEC